MINYENQNQGEKNLQYRLCQKLTMIIGNITKHQAIQFLIKSSPSITSRSILKLSIKRFCTKKQNEPKDPNNSQQFPKDLIQNELQEQQNLATMKKNYEEVQVQSFKGKSFSNLTELQRKIIQDGKFDLAHPQIKPKLASMSLIPGLQTTEQITQIQLGNIKIKEKNQVFLSEIDPYNIPQDYKIRFDQQKKLTIIGKRVQKSKSPQNSSNDLSRTPQSTEMPISLAQSFQQKSLSQLSEKYMGQIGYKYQFNRKRSFKELLLAIPIILFFLQPIVGTVDEVYECIKSIQEIEEEQMKEIKKVKKAGMVNALLNNKDFNQLI